MKFTLITLLIIFIKIIASTDDESDKEYKYYITYPDRVGRCPGLELYAITDAIDGREILFDDDEARLNGSLTFKKSFNPELPINLKVTMEVKKQGKWERHPFTLEISDVCKVFYTSNDHELYEITKHWNTDETKDCPFQVKTSYPLKNVRLKRIYTMKRKEETGEYLFTLRVTQGSAIYACTTIQVTLRDFEEGDDDYGDE